MTVPLAASITVLAAIITNRIVAVAVGLWFGVPAMLLLSVLLLIDVIQIPFYYQIYEHGSEILEGFPFLRNLLRRDWTKSALGKWALPLGGFGVMLVAALPTFGGGMWSATFIAYGLGLKRRASYAWQMSGSVLSYVTLYWILDAVIRTIRYFIHA